MNKRTTFQTIALILACALLLAACGGAAPAADGSLCGFLTPSLLQQVTGLAFEGPEVSDATTGGVEVAGSAVCTFTAGDAKAVLTIFQDESPEAAQAAFDQFKADFEVLAELPGVGDAAYVDKNGQLHLRKGAYRTFLELTLPQMDAAALGGYAGLIGPLLAGALP